MNYYNEFDPKAAAWLRELIKAGLIPAGDVDERSITEIKAHELSKYTQCHFFAGIGGWSLALQLANWPVSRPVGTGSCPCQPFSAAGKQLGNADDRHLWPVFFRLIVACRALGQRWTDSIFGEQVESAIAHGWLDSLSADMEGEGYAVGAAILGAHSVGAPHRRQRLYWVADAQSPRGCRGREMEGGGYSQLGGRSTVVSPMEHPASNGREQRGTSPSERSIVSGCSDSRIMGDIDHTGSQGRGLQSGSESNLFETWTRGVDFVACTDGRKRLVKSGIFPLAHGFPARVGLLRGSGNAIVPQTAARFVQFAEDCLADHRNDRTGLTLGAQTQPLILDE